MSPKTKKLVGIGSALALSLVGVASAFAQTVPTWDTSSTETVVTAASTAFKTTFVYVLQVIAPYAIIVGLIVGVVWFFRGMARRHGN